jgi:hypothetical protein
VKISLGTYQEVHVSRSTAGARGIMVSEDTLG